MLFVVLCPENKKSIMTIYYNFEKCRLHSNREDTVDGDSVMHASRITVRRATVASEPNVSISENSMNRTFDSLDLSIGHQSTPIAPKCILKRSRSVGAIAKNVSFDLNRNEMFFIERSFSQSESHAESSVHGRVSIEIETRGIDNDASTTTGNPHEYLATDTKLSTVTKGMKQADDSAHGSISPTVDVDNSNAFADGNDPAEVSTHDSSLHSEESDNLNTSAKGTDQAVDSAHGCTSPTVDFDNSNAAANGNDQAEDSTLDPNLHSEESGNLNAAAKSTDQAVESAHDSTSSSEDSSDDGESSNALSSEDSSLPPPQQPLYESAT